MATQALVYLLMLMFARVSVSDPGWLAQGLYRFYSIATNDDANFCVEPCFSVREAPTHTCANHCDCDGARLCSLFGFCTSASGQCEKGGHGWQLIASDPHVSVGENISSNHTWVYNLESSAFIAAESAGDEFEVVGSWSSAFSLGGVPNLALQLYLRRCSAIRDCTGSLRLTGHDGYFVRVQIAYFDHVFTYESALPLRGWQNEEAPVELSIPTMQYLSDCVYNISKGYPHQCGPITLHLLDMQYVPTFTSDRFPPGVLQLLRPSASLALRFTLPGIGQFTLKVFPAGDLDSRPGHRAALLLVPSGVEIRFILRIGSRVLGTFAEPLSCRHVNGCFFRNLGKTYDHERWATIAVSVLGVDLPVWGDGKDSSGSDAGAVAQSKTWSSLHNL